MKDTTFNISEILTQMPYKDDDSCKDKNTE